MDDLLFKTALEFGKLTNLGYKIVVGRKKKAYTIQLRFPVDSFFHLAGLQHLEDITFPSKNKERIYKEILNKNLTYNTIKKSVFFEEYFIEERLFFLNRLKELVEGCNLLFLIHPTEYIKYTKIFAHYLCEYQLPEDSSCILYLFLIKNNFPKVEFECKCCSFFKKHEIDFRKGTSETKLLLVQKYIYVDTENEIIQELFRNPSYKE